MTITPAGTGRIFGYARVSTEEQSLDIQISDLLKDGVHPALLFKEKMSGTTRTGRVELERVMAILGPGDVLTITRIDRLARSMIDIFSLLKELEAIGAHLRVIHSPVDTSTPQGKFFFAAMAMVAETEHALRRERQREGIERAKKEGRMKGRPPSVDKSEILKLHAQGWNKSKIARELGCHRASVIRAIEASEAAA